MNLLTLQQNMSAWLTSEAEPAADRFASSARPGLTVYLNNYRSQLMSCLSTSFPMLRAWMGDAAFEVAAATHIDRVPPHTWTLDAYALDFPESLATLYPSDPEITELARLERELEAAFVGCDGVPVDPAALGDVDWERAILHFVPTLRMLSVTTNVSEIGSAIRAGELPPAVEHWRVPSSIVTWRDGFVPKFRALDADERGAIDLLRSGRTFAQLCAVLVERFGEKRGPQLAGSWLGRWLSDHMVADVTIPREICRS